MTSPERVIVLFSPSGEAEFDSTGRSRLWDEMLPAVQRAVPGAASLRPGYCAMRARGPARYYRGEAEAAAAILEQVTAIDLAQATADARVGVASGRFAAELATQVGEDHPKLQRPNAGVRIVADADTRAFLAPIPVALVLDAEFANKLVALGARTLGDFAAFPEQSVLQRFGGSALAAHRRARGLGEWHADEVPATTPIRELSTRLEFEPPLSADDQLAFACSAPAESFIRGLHSAGFVCTELRVELRDENGAVYEREWSHPSSFTASDVVNRVRWQGAALPRSEERSGAGVSEVHLVPARTARAAEHEPGLWSSAPDQRVHHQLTRVQSLVGHEGVGTGALTGGRLVTDRQLLVPWGTKAQIAVSGARPRDGPWPGSIQSALPSALFSEPLPAKFLGESGNEVTIDDEDLLSERPTALVVEAWAREAVHSWSMPWPLHERWWSNGTRIYRLQVLLESGDAWLLNYREPRGWAAEGKYS